jgi:hypothetical protein
MLDTINSAAKFSGFIEVVLLEGRGAGEGNRTLVCSLGSCRSAIELHPRADQLTKISEIVYWDKQSELVFRAGSHNVYKEAINFIELSMETSEVCTSREIVQPGTRF